MVILNLSGGVKEDMGDIQYLATQEYNGNIVRLSDDINNLTDKLSYTVPKGKDAYILVTKIIPTNFVQAASSSFGNISNVNNNHTEAKISINTKELDRVTVGMSTSTRSVNAPYNADSAGWLRLWLYD